MKYVMFKSRLGGLIRFFPIIFGEDLTHSEVAEAISTMRMGTTHNWVRPEAVSAGFVDKQIGTGWSVCHGESESLKMKPHPDDAKIIDTLSYLHGLCFDEREPVRPPDVIHLGDKSKASGEGVRKP